MANRIEFSGDLTADGFMLQWQGENVGQETLPAASTHDYLLLFDADNVFVAEEKFTRQGELAPGAAYESFAYIQQPAGDYVGYLTLDQDGDVETIDARQRQFRLQVLEDRVIVY
jgi:hypothetical protein